METVEESRPRPNIDNGKSLSSSERIIPITVLGSRHNNDENDNTSASTKRLSVVTVATEAPTAASSTTTTRPPTTSINNNLEATKRHSLLVTLDDGSTTETQGSVTKLKGASGISDAACTGSGTQGPLSIEEIGHDTLMREIRRSSTSSSPRRSPSPQKDKIRVVPIKLADGKVMHQQPEESVQIRTEFTNYTHQEFNDTDPEIPRMDSDAEPKAKKSPSSEEAKMKIEQRIVPIKLLETGETIMPSFTALEDPQPPEWSTFSKMNKAKERQVPLNVENGSPSNRGRETSRSTPEKQQPPRPQSRSSSAKKNTVRFDLNDGEHSERSEHTTTERRSSSVETVTRKTTTNTVGGKPPSMPRSSVRSTTRTSTAPNENHRWRPQSAERPASATPLISPGTERTLQEIDRDINQIWRELQELEKLPNGTYRTRTPPRAGAGTTVGSSSTPIGARTPPPPRPASASGQLPIQPVKVKAGYTAVSASPKYSEPLNRTGLAEQIKPPATPPTRRTIWDMDQNTTTAPSLPSAASLPPTIASPISASVNKPKAEMEFKAPVTSPLMRPPPPPIPPHLRPSTIKMAPIARDESLHDLGDSKSPSTVSFYDNEYSPSGKFKGFPYIDGAPPSRRRSKSPTKDPNSQKSVDSSNNFTVSVDKSTQTQDEKQKSKDACTIL